MSVNSKETELSAFREQKQMRGPLKEHQGKFLSSEDVMKMENKNSGKLGIQNNKYMPREYIVNASCTMELKHHT